MSFPRVPLEQEMEGVRPQGPQATWTLSLVTRDHIFQQKCHLLLWFPRAEAVTVPDTQTCMWTHTLTFSRSLTHQVSHSCPHTLTQSLTHHIHTLTLKHHTSHSYTNSQPTLTPPLPTLPSVLWPRGCVCVFFSHLSPTNHLCSLSNQTLKLPYETEFFLSCSLLLGTPWLSMVWVSLQNPLLRFQGGPASTTGSACSMDGGVTPGLAAVRCHRYQLSL
jgi:hypothetical protein